MGLFYLLQSFTDNTYMDKVKVQCSLYAPYRGKRRIVPHIPNLGTSWSKVKLEFTLEQVTKAQRGSRCIALPFNLGARWGWVVIATPRPIYPREIPGTHFIGGWVGPRTGLDGWEKSRPPPGFNPRTVQPAVSRYTDWAILARRH
jgi:hypothetical protein